MTAPLRGASIAALGHCYVTHAAAAQVCDHIADGDVEAARRLLTTWLLAAKCGEPPRPGDAWPVRARSRETGLDVTARVVSQDGLAIVLSAVVRGVGRSGRR